MITVVFLVFIFQLFFTFPLFAQQSDFDRAYQDYLYNFNQYQEAHQKYVDAKIAYLKYQTLTAKNEALKSTLKMLQQRDEVMRTYLTVIKMRLVDAQGITDYEKQIIYSKIDDLISWCVGHKSLLSSAGSLEDLIAFSKMANEKYQEAETIAYQVLGIIPGGKIEILKDEVDRETSKVEDIISEIKQRGDKNTAMLERWFLDAGNKISLSQGKQFEAQQAVTGGSSLGLHNQVLYIYGQSLQYLKETVTIYKELISEVKIAD